MHIRCLVILKYNLIKCTYNIRRFYINYINDENKCTTIHQSQNSNTKN